ncbi:unnamed protein product [Lactuca virosa]|uniref:F-box domain-containing protein n=1 Tax=Lactuca virosa TaxID=75947 RepID=A0AAU9MYW6_9ASTR|nr:unnamed protein product [Lactuca virosa]
MNNFLLTSPKGKWMEKSEPPKASNFEDDVDFISSMPDAILLLILSRLLSTEEVIRSSILSRRWKYLWTAVPSLHIRYRRELKKTKFIEFVYWVLANITVNLDSFRLYCGDYYCMSTVWRWIHVAVRKNVKELHLELHPNKLTDVFEMPHCLATCGSLEVLKLYLSARLLRLPNIMGFPALRVLDLTYVDLEDDNLINNFLESCPLLEELSLICCFMNELALLRISNPNLKRLRIDNNENLLMCSGIKICCPKLVDMDLTGNIAYRIFFECLDSLKVVVIQPKFEGITKSVLFPGISRVEHLSIDLFFFLECIYAARDPVLPNLKTLVIKTTMDAFTMENFNKVLKYYPKLESLKLIIKQDFDEKYEWLDEAETREILTSDVERVEFFEFNGEKPKLVIDWFEDLLHLFFTWGDFGDRFPYWL